MDCYSYSLLEFLGIKYWINKNILFPFIVQEIASNSQFIAILPLYRRVLENKFYLKKIQELYSKMLTVLELDRFKSSKFIFSCEENQIFVKADQQSASLNLLKINPKILLIFGDANFLDKDLLQSNNVKFFHTLHPEYLLTNPEAKKIAFKDLLACKDAIKTLN